MRKIRLIVLLFIITCFISACFQVSPKTGMLIKPTASPVLDQILKKGELIVGTVGNMPPLNMTSKDGEVIGLEADMAHYIAGSMGVDLKMTTMPFVKLLPALKNREIDMIMADMTMTGQRNLDVAFVGPYFISGKAFLTKRKTIAAAKDPVDINSPDTRLVALEGSTSQMFIETIIPKAKLTTALNFNQAVELVIQDKVDALMADYPICVFYTLRYRDKGLVSIITPLTYEPIGIALPPSDPLLMNWMENFLRTMKSSGRLEKLKKKWFTPGPWIDEVK
jgi:polar amino acid transport system substrate-binding protein